MSKQNRVTAIVFYVVRESMVQKMHALLVMVPIKMPAKYTLSGTTTRSLGRALTHAGHVLWGDTLLIAEQTLCLHVCFVQLGSI